MRKTGIMMAVACLLATGYHGTASAVTFTTGDLANWASLTKKTVPHPSDSFGAEGATAESGVGLEYSWGLAGRFASAMVIVSTDHVMSASDLFKLEVSGFDDSSSSWITGAFSGKTYRVAGPDYLDDDDYAMRFDFSAPVSRVGVYSYGTMALSESALADTRAEFDGVSAVPEPSTLLLLGTGAAGLAFIRKRIRI